MRDIIVIVAMLIGALCSTGQQLKSDRDACADDVTASVAYVRQAGAAYDNAVAHRHGCQVSITGHVAWHNCYPEACGTLRDLLFDLDQAYIQENCASEELSSSEAALQYCRQQLDIAQSAYDNHFPCDDCDTGE